MGVPLGPYMSVATPTRNVAVNMMIIYATLRTLSNKCSMKKIPMRFGLAMAEVNTGGRYYKTHPFVFSVRQSSDLNEVLDHYMPTPSTSAVRELYPELEFKEPGSLVVNLFPRLLIGRSFES